MNEFFLSIGSNVEPEKHIPACLKLLKEQLGLDRISSIYETAPIGPAGEKKFWNLTVSVNTDLSATGLTKNIKVVENLLGRKRDPNNRFAPRIIDIDVLPHKDYQKHAFIMIPLAEIYPEGIDSQTGKTYRELALECEQSADIIKKVELS